MTQAYRQMLISMPMISSLESSKAAIARQVVVLNAGNGNDAPFSSRGWEPPLLRRVDAVSRKGIQPFLYAFELFASDIKASQKRSFAAQRIRCFSNVAEDKIWAL
jgi:hypothetical protein